MDGLIGAVEARLTRSALPATTVELVRAAFDGEAAVEDLLEHGLAGGDTRTGPGTALEPVGAYITALEVEGFRGIGERARLELVPGPGLTLIIGRNGSGKSSFAEAMEVLFTGDNPRWAKRSAVWREGWKNLHHDTTQISATLAVEGIAGSTAVTRSWSANASLDGSSVEVQPHGLPKTDLAFLGWDDALPMYRPFLSYSELGSMFDEGPTKLHDAVSSVLGLDELTAAQNVLRNARLARQKKVRAALARRDEIVAVLEGLDDERARQCVAALRGGMPALDTVEKIVTAGHPVDTGGELARLRRIVGLERPDRESVLATASSLRDAQTAVAELAGTVDDAMLRSADLLEAALAYLADHPSDECPVCGSTGTVGGDWQVRAREQVDEQRRIAQIAQRERRRLQSALKTAQGLPDDVPAAVQDARGLLDVEPVIAAWRPWVALRDETDPARLAAGLEASIDPVVVALEALVAQAETAVAAREDAWRPIASTLAAWVSQARPAFAAAARVDDLAKAESWLKEAAGEIRNDRFAPIADRSMAIWKTLRQRSNVELGRIELKGSGSARKVTLDVTVDGVPGAALGVMSQGELHALALSLFFPRATLQESPFRFVVVDDPVQSMDPAKVDGLARVLEDAARTRQVVVFTHDDRLPEAVRRLGIEGSIIEVSRREGSGVDLRPALTPIERHIQDARSLVRTDDLPPTVAARVVPGFCRLAIEAGCVEAVRRRRIGRGEPHAEVEDALRSVTRLTGYAALALFDDPNRGGDVLARINSSYGSAKADAFQAANKGSHGGFTGDLDSLVRNSAMLARELAEAK
jgi:recombinational DNA repair ATPase RecF